MKKMYFLKNKTKFSLLAGLLLSIFSIQTYAQTGAALNFDGVDDRVDLGTTIGNFGTGNFTVETWFKTTATGDRTIIGKRVGCNAGNFWNLRLINGLLDFEVYGAANVFVQSPLSTYNDGNWHHVACVRNNNTYTLYADGVLVAQNYSGTGAAAAYNFTNAVSLYIGNSACGFYQGSLDETRIWNIARTSYEIQQTYNCEIAGASTGLLVNLHYNQGIGGGTNTGITTATDASGNNNNGTLTGFALTGATSNWITPGAVPSGVSCAAVASQNFQMNGLGGQNWNGGNCYTLTVNQQALFGSIWYKQKVDLTQDFDMSANLNFGTNNSPGADGITFAFQNVCTSAGTGGGDIGIGTVSPSLIVEFDTYQNGAYGDPAYDHLAIEKNGILDHNAATALVAPIQINPANANVEDGTDYLVRILWTHSTNTLDVYVNGGLRTTYTGDIVAQIFAGSPYVYWGFTAGTGGEFNNQTVCVTTMPTNIVSLAGAATICNGSGYQANVPGYSTYSWTPTTGVSNAAIGNPLLSPTTTTTYTLSVTDACANVQTQTITVTVNPIPNVTAGGTATVCAGTGTQLTSTGGTTYSWSPATGLSNTNIANPTATPSATTTYTVTGTTNGCSATATVTVTVNAVSSTVATGTTTTCGGGGVQLGASGASTYTWLPNIALDNAFIANPIAAPVVTTTYTVTGTAAGCSSTATVTITVNPIPTVSVSSPTICMGQTASITATVSPSGGTYVWTPNLGSGQTITDNPTTATTYSVVYTAGGCTNSASGTVTVNPTPTAATIPDTIICPGITIPLSSSGGTTYSWLPATGLSNAGIANPDATPTVTTTYTVTVGNGFSCSSTATVTITLNGVNASAGSDVSITCGNTATLNGTGGTTYSWSPSTGLSSATIATPVANPQATTTYTVTVDNSTCTGTASVTVTVEGYTTNAGSDVTICQGQNTTLSGTVTPSNGIYQNVSTGYTFSSNVGSYSNFTGGTVIFDSNSPTMDDAVSGPVTIPSFNFNNQTFTTIYISTNGFITFGSAPTATNYYPLSGTESYAGCVSPFGTDLAAYSSFNSDIRTNQFGSNFVIQWKNFGRFGSFGTVDEQISFAIYLNTSTNAISVIYSSLSFTSSANYYPQVGIRGSNNSFATNINNRTIPLQGGSWLNNTTAGTSNASTCGINGSPGATNPGSGTVFNWTPATFLPATYSWSPSTGLSSSTSLSPVASPASTTTYTLTANYGSCSSTSSVMVTVDVCSGAAEINNNAGINIYPNPTSGIFTLKVNREEAIANKGQLFIEIYDVLGNKVVQFEIINSKSEINIESFENGLYFVKVMDSNSNTVYLQKVVKD